LNFYSDVTQKVLTSTGDRTNFDITYFLAINIKDYIVINIILESKILLFCSYIRHTKCFC
jgi:hypothetical protein